MVEMAEQLAGMGYVVLVPEMYYRSGPYEPFQLATVFTDPDERARLGVLASALTIDAAACHWRALGDLHGAMLTT